MKILVLGHKGLLGSDLVEILRGAHTVRGADVEDFDLTSATDCLRMIENFEPEVVINAAAYTDVDGCETNRDLCFAVNAEGVRNVALACKGKGIKIVHFTTDYVFDGTKKTPYVEEDVYCPISVYGRSKLMGDQYLMDYSDSFLLIRTAWIYGGKGRNFARTILEKARTEKILRIVDDQFGTPTYTVDLSNAVRLLVEGDHTGLFHVTNRGKTSWYEYALKILEYAGISNVEVEPIKSGQLDRKAARPHYSVLSCQKFMEATGKTMRPWQIALREYISRTR
jgi:dTDP-4-dehydrorhamnose reductase